MEKKVNFDVPFSNPVGECIVKANKQNLEALLNKVELYMIQYKKQLMEDYQLYPIYKALLDKYYDTKDYFPNEVCLNHAVRALLKVFPRKFTLILALKYLGNLELSYFSIHKTLFWCEGVNDVDNEEIPLITSFTTVDTIRNVLINLLDTRESFKSQPGSEIFDWSGQMMVVLWMKNPAEMQQIMMSLTQKAQDSVFLLIETLGVPRLSQLSEQKKKYNLIEAKERKTKFLPDSVVTDANKCEAPLERGSNEYIANFRKIHLDESKDCIAPQTTTEVASLLVTQPPYKFLGEKKQSVMAVVNEPFKEIEEHLLDEQVQEKLNVIRESNENILGHMLEGPIEDSHVIKDSFKDNKPKEYSRPSGILQEQMPKPCEKITRYVLEEQVQKTCFVGEGPKENIAEHQEHKQNIMFNVKPSFFEDKSPEKPIQGMVHTFKKPCVNIAQHRLQGEMQDVLHPVKKSNKRILKRSLQDHVQRTFYIPKMQCEEILECKHSLQEQVPGVMNFIYEPDCGIVNYNDFQKEALDQLCKVVQPSSKDIAEHILEELLQETFCMIDESCKGKVKHIFEKEKQDKLCMINAASGNVVKHSLQERGLGQLNKVEQSSNEIAAHVLEELLQKTFNNIKESCDAQQLKKNDKSYEESDPVGDKKVRLVHLSFPKSLRQRKLSVRADKDYLSRYDTSQELKTPFPKTITMKKTHKGHKVKEDNSSLPGILLQNTQLPMKISRKPDEAPVRGLLPDEQLMQMLFYVQEAKTKNDKKEQGEIEEGHNVLVQSSSLSNITAQKTKLPENICRQINQAQKYCKLKPVYFKPEAGTQNVKKTLRVSGDRHKLKVKSSSTINVKISQKETDGHDLQGENSILSDFSGRKTKLKVMTWEGTDQGSRRYLISQKKTKTYYCEPEANAQNTTKTERATGETNKIKEESSTINVEQSKKETDDGHELHGRNSSLSNFSVRNTKLRMIKRGETNQHLIAQNNLRPVFYKSEANAKRGKKTLCITDGTHILKGESCSTKNMRRPKKETDEHELQGKNSFPSDFLGQKTNLKFMTWEETDQGSRRYLTARNKAKTLNVKPVAKTHIVGKAPSLTEERDELKEESSPAKNTKNSNEMLGETDKINILKGKCSSNINLMKAQRETDGGHELQGKSSAISDTPTNKTKSVSTLKFLKNSSSKFSSIFKPKKKKSQTGFDGIEQKIADVTSSPNSKEMEEFKNCKTLIAEIEKLKDEISDCSIELKTTEVLIEQFRYKIKRNTVMYNNLHRELAEFHRGAMGDYYTD